MVPSAKYSMVCKSRSSWRREELRIVLTWAKNCSPLVMRSCFFVGDVSFQITRAAHRTRVAWDVAWYSGRGHYCSVQGKVKIRFVLFAQLVMTRRGLVFHALLALADFLVIFGKDWNTFKGQWVTKWSSWLEGFEAFPAVAMLLLDKATTSAQASLIWSKVLWEFLMPKIGGTWAPWDLFTF